MNLALNKVVSSRNTYEDGTYFSLSFPTDGVHEDISVNSHQGWSVDPYSRLDRDAVVDPTLDADAVYRITSVKLRPCLYNRGQLHAGGFRDPVVPGRQGVCHGQDGRGADAGGSIGSDLHGGRRRGALYPDPYHQALRCDRRRAGRGSLPIGEIEVYGKDIDEPTTAESTTETETTAPETKTETASETKSETTHTAESSADSTTAETAAVTAGGTAETATGGTGSKSGCGSAIGGVIAVLARSSRRALLSAKRTSAIRQNNKKEPSDPDSGPTIPGTSEYSARDDLPAACRRSAARWIFRVPALFAPPRRL